MNSCDFDYLKNLQINVDKKNEAKLAMPHSKSI